jgi:hypothetical protein
MVRCMSRPRAFSEVVIVVCVHDLRQLLDIGSSKKIRSPRACTVWHIVQVCAAQIYRSLCFKIILLIPVGNALL